MHRTLLTAIMILTELFQPHVCVLRHEGETERGRGRLAEPVTEEEVSF